MREYFTPLFLPDISYSQHEVTYLSGRKQLRGCIAAVKSSDATLPEKNGSHELWIFVRLPPYIL